MTTPRGTYSGGYYATSAFFPDTPIYDSLVAERGTPQIAPIRVPSPYDTGSNLPALPALPALPSAPASHTPAQGTYTGYQQPTGYQPQPAPAAYIPQQASAPRGYPGAQPAPSQPQQQIANPAGYDMRPVPPRQMPPRQPAPGSYNTGATGYPGTVQPGYGEEQYRRPYNGPGY
ncbi:MULTISPECIES: DUF6643 family protein [Streptomycetaceae]|uniref:Uncharacterized protein n=1 Tax=Streptantibioticus cattleyicolor (strain ATCC 35852 / DSM 46488 / JCM 4925 / NBRC 14057 / NRRL 8057) TaxID=1003195 RepID=F8JV67_STREN|nr:MULTISPECIES: DUF6643 family protein [Streptomycetaceae]AEW93153.1 hypothetical protein SCATT_07820 [Streptantibioticus cattleyicolor NRRL 8057 = DSM 46488]MYS57879.1 hypothetical protein [Streptomyces sp. SID5468]CCB73510.1 conserved protein of unknown function [Streptantibioticus cattleyicolor NRRL 8057 = DSM 46488]